MRLRALHLQHFRNIAEAHLEELEACNHFFYGENAQGKTNLLEAIHLLTAVRSFRTARSNELITHGKTQSILHYHLSHDLEEETSVRIENFTRANKKIYQDDENITRFQNFIGKFPTVVFSSQDIQLLRGGPALRRRFIDLHFSSIDHEYFDCLRKFHQALKQRNEILKQERPSFSLIAPFHRILAHYAQMLTNLRQKHLAQFEPLFQSAYAIISAERDTVSLSYKHQNTETEEAWEALYKEQFALDQRLGSTRHGPHRDDFLCQLNEHPAHQFASEGQQRSLVLSLRLAQISHWIKTKRILPIVLADDILGELDSTRAVNFWKAIPPDIQIFATGTRIPEQAKTSHWTLWKIQNGQVKKES